MIKNEKLSQVSITNRYEGENVMSLIVFKSKHKGEAEWGSQAQDAGQNTKTSQIQTDLELETS